jgi:PAS domain S-box-containing protein
MADASALGLAGGRDSFFPCGMSGQEGGNKISEAKQWYAPAVRIALIYGVVSAVWIFASDYLLYRFVPASRKLEWVSVFKGWCFVWGTAVLLWWLMRCLLGRLNVSRLALEERERQLATLFHGVNEAVIVADPEDGSIVLTNRTAERMFQLSQEQLRSQNAESLSSGALRYDPVIARRLMRRSMQGEEVSIEWHCKRADGSTFWAEVVSRMVPLAGKTRLLVSIRDISERRKALHDARESRAMLRALVTRNEKTREMERTRISREVHDVLGQLLTAIKLGHGSLERKVRVIPDQDLKSEMVGKLGQLEELTDQMLVSIREISHDLRPVKLEETGLVESLEAEVRTFSARSGISCVTGELAAGVSLAPDRAMQVFRVCQEALTNVARHAGASRAVVSLRRTGGELELRIEDDGCGIRDEQIAAMGSLGLAGMSERAELLGGVMLIERGQATGTIVTLTFPEIFP